MRRRASSLPEVFQEVMGRILQAPRIIPLKMIQNDLIFHEILCIQVSAESIVSQHNSITGLEFDGLGFILEA